jgi:alanyl-tRNA synthetase
LKDIEREVNRRVRLNEDVLTRLMTPDEATKEGAMALFGEKYGDEVRVLFMGGREDQPEKGKEYFSVELCGGTHVKRTGDIGVFKIIAESAVSSGVRRIEAVTGAGALAWFEQEEKTLRAAADALKSSPADVPARVAQLLEERKKLEKEVTELRQKAALGGVSGGAAQASSAVPKQISGVNFVGRVLPDVPAKDLKPMADAFKAQVKSGVIALAASFEDKVSLVVAVTDDLTKKFSAVDLVKVGAEQVGGKGGGGRPDMAQAGGSDVNAMAQAIAAIERALEGKAKAA